MRMSNPENAQEAMLGNESATPEPAVAPSAEVHTDTLPSIEEQFRASLN
jgi:molecular chaperone GrpE